MNIFTCPVTIISARRDEYSADESTSCQLCPAGDSCAEPSSAPVSCNVGELSAARGRQFCI